MTTADIQQRVAALESTGTQTEKKLETLFDFHNKEIVPFMSEVRSEFRVISTQNGNTTKIQEKLLEGMKEISDEQIKCQAARKAERAILDAAKTSTLDAAVKAGAWAGVGVFILGMLSGAYYALKFILKGLAAGA